MSNMTKNDLFKGPQYSHHTRDMKSDMRIYMGILGVPLKQGCELRSHIYEGTGKEILHQYDKIL